MLLTLGSDPVSSSVLMITNTPNPKEDAGCSCREYHNCPVGDPMPKESFMMKR